ncbi:MAG TPA: tetratricopeptide repeat protein [Polyangia bacterium]|nr:tetratricopeptide repeat protein [Polyangia bacterium]
MNLRRAAAAVVLFLAALGMDAVAHAQADRMARARQLYSVGRDAYNAGDFAKALDAFKESFSLSHEPALLYNIASALQGLKQPHEAAEELRSYLRLKPADPDRPQIEERIRTLEEEQRLLDLDKPQPTPTPTPVAPPTPTPAVNPPANNTLTVVAPDTAHEKQRMRRRTALIVGLTAGAVVIAGVAVGLAFGLQPHEQALTPSIVGPIKSTE